MSEVKAAQPRHGLLGPPGDPVQVVLHLGGEGVVDEPGEVALEQVHHREGGERRHQRRALPPHVSPVQDGAHDGGVGGGTAHPELLEPVYQRRLGEAGRGLGLVALGGHGLGRGPVAPPQGRKLRIARRPAPAAIAGPSTAPAGTAGRPGGAVACSGPVAGVAAVLVGQAEAGVGDDGAGRGEHHVRGRLRFGGELQPHRLAGAVGHLAGQGALVDDLVHPGLRRGHAAGHFGRQPERVPGRPDGLVGLLGVS